MSSCIFTHYSKARALTFPVSFDDKLFTYDACSKNFSMFSLLTTKLEVILLTVKIKMSKMLNVTFSGVT